MSQTRFSVVFGLTTDPIHKGHEQAIINGLEYCREQGIEIEQFLLIPVYQPNLIDGKKLPVACFEQRFAMCELAANRLSKQLDCDIQVSRIEKTLALSTGKNNFSINTIKQLKHEKPLFMISTDHFQGLWPKFRQWQNWQGLLKLCGLLINQRPGNRINQNFIQQLTLINENIFVVGNTEVVAVSSSEIRNNLKLLNKTNFVAEDIAEYIQQHNMYD